MDAKKLLLIKSLVTSRPVSSCFREIAELIEKGQVLYSDKHFHSHNQKHFYFGMNFENSLKLTKIV